MTSDAAALRRRRAGNTAATNISLLIRVSRHTILAAGCLNPLPNDSHVSPPMISISRDIGNTSFTHIINKLRADALLLIKREIPPNALLYMLH